MVEKFNVEFDVEKTTKRKYGFEEKIIRFRGGVTRYKAIVKNKILVAILGARYTLIPNELVLKKVTAVAKSLGAKVTVNEEDWRIWIEVEDGNYGVLVRNSVDGTTSLGVDATININGGSARAVMSASKISNIYRKHTSLADVKYLKKEIKAIMEASRKYGDWLVKMKSYTVPDQKEALGVLLDKLPKFYTEGLENMMKGYSLGNPATVYDAYVMIAKRIWKREGKMVTKMTWFRHLNDVVFCIAGMDW